ncbi:MAG: hypothetical protein C4K58_05950 [Flavobacteriaceae bacterium]|nr:MAG: hypothetical protein C4K58_05950 [Flavobacteriaceae bacterium]
MHQNVFHPESRNQAVEIPLLLSHELILKMLEEKTGKEFEERKFPVSKEVAQKIYSVSKKQVLQEMMWESDNFLAEQILLMCGETLLGELNTTKTIEAIQNQKRISSAFLQKWVDASGLSRYNLISPMQLVEVLGRIKTENPSDFLDYFPSGGQRGTLKNSYKSTNGKPYVYAKTGSMGGVYNLSGYIITNQNKVVTFGLLNTNFDSKGSIFKSKIEEILLYIRENY